VTGAIETAFIERYQAAARSFSRGDPGPVKALYSHKEDVTPVKPVRPGGPRLGQGFGCA